MTQLDRTLAKSLHCQLGNLRSHVSSSHIVPVTQSKHKSLVPHSLIIQTWSLLVFLGYPMHLNFFDNILTNSKSSPDGLVLEFEAFWYKTEIKMIYFVPLCLILWFTLTLNFCYSKQKNSLIFF